MDDKQKKEFEDLIVRAIQSGKSETSNLVNDILKRIEEKQPKNGANFINKWWKLGALIVALVIAWTTIQLNVQANSDELKEINTELSLRGPRITTNENNIMNIEEDINEIKVDIKEILREIRK